MKNAKLKTFIVFIIMIAIFAFIIKDDYKNIIDTLGRANHLLIILALIFIFIYYCLKAKCLHIITEKHKKSVTYKEMFNQTLITQFFNGITPFSTGGQPMQIYMLNKSGISIANSTSIIIQDFLMYQLALVTIGIFALVINGFTHFINIGPALYSLILLGFAINTIIGLGLVFISFSRRFNNFIGKLIIKLASKVRIIKNKEEILEKWESKLDEFHDSAKIFKKEKGLFAKCYFFNLLALFVFYLIPFLIFVSFDPSCGITVSSAIASSAFVLLVGNFVPIPGGSVGIEVSFSMIFGGFIKESLVSPALLIWRTITYYIGVFIGGIAFSIYEGREKK